MSRNIPSFVRLLGWILFLALSSFRLQALNIIQDGSTSCKNALPSQFLFSLLRDPEGFKQKVRAELARQGGDPNKVQIPELREPAMRLTEAIRADLSSPVLQMLLSEDPVAKASVEQLLRRLESFQRNPLAVNYVDLSRRFSVFMGWKEGEEVSDLFGPTSRLGGGPPQLKKNHLTWLQILNRRFLNETPQALDFYDYFFIPLPQDDIDLLSGDEFQKLSNHSIFLGGLLYNSRKGVHGSNQPMSPEKFLEHDAQHARIIYLSHNAFLNEVIRPGVSGAIFLRDPIRVLEDSAPAHNIFTSAKLYNYYSRLSELNDPQGEKEAEALRAARALIRNQAIKKVLSYLTWELFFEKASPRTALDLYTWVRASRELSPLSSHERPKLRLMELPSAAQFFNDYPFLVEGFSSDREAYESYGKALVWMEQHFFKRLSARNYRTAEIESLYEERFESHKVREPMIPNAYSGFPRRL